MPDTATMEQVVVTKEKYPDVPVPTLPPEWTSLIPKKHTYYVSQRHGASRSVALLCLCGNNVLIKRGAEEPDLTHWQQLIRKCLLTVGAIGSKDVIDWPVTDQPVADTDSLKASIPLKSVTTESVPLVDPKPKRKYTRRAS